MTKRSCLLLAMMIILLLVSACGDDPTPDPTVVAQMAEEMVKATLTAQPTPTPLNTEANIVVPITSTPSPVTHTATLPTTATAAATSTPERPPVKNYSFDEFGFSFDYPGDYPLAVDDKSVTSHDDEGFFFIIRSVSRYYEKELGFEEGMEEEGIAEIYAEVGMEYLVALDCAGLEVTHDGVWRAPPDGSHSWITAGTCQSTDWSADRSINWQSIGVLTEDQANLIVMLYEVPSHEDLPQIIETTFQTFEPVRPPAFVEIDKESTNLRAGPGKRHPAVSSAKQGDTFEISGKNNRGTWWEVCCIDGKPAWVSDSAVSAGGDLKVVLVAENIPTPFPKPTAVPTKIPVRAGLHERQTVSNWEIQPERVHKEKVVYHYGDSYVAMGDYAIIIVLAKNIAPGTDDMNRTLALGLRDDKGRIYDYSDSYSVERYANIAAAWQFVVHPTPFRNIAPGSETPLIMVWDVSPDVESLTLILTDGKTRAEWDLGNFSNIPPYEKEN